MVENVNHCLLIILHIFQLLKYACFKGHEKWSVDYQIRLDVLSDLIV